MDVGDGGGEAHRADLAQSPWVVPRRDGEELLGTVGEAEHGDVVPANRIRTTIGWILKFLKFV